MAKGKPKTIEDALDQFAMGKSSRECEKLTGIPKTTVDREAKKRGIIKGSVGTLIADKVKVEAEIGTLPGTLRTLVNDEVDKQIKMLAFFNDSSVVHCKIMMDQVQQKHKAKQEIPFIDHKTIQSTLREGKETVFGKMPETVINNTNAQQTNKEKKVIFEVIGGTTRST
jgi:hypothetical protein